MLTTTRLFQLQNKGYYALNSHTLTFVSCWSACNQLYCNTVYNGGVKQIIVDTELMDVRARLSKLYDALETGKLELNDLAPRIVE